MRYYLAFDAYLHTLDSPAPQRFERVSSAGSPTRSASRVSYAK